MTDFEADETVAPLKQATITPVVSKTDRFLTMTGVAMAVAAAMFPWYVFLNAEKFGVRPADWTRTRDLPEGPGRNVFTVSPLALVDRDDEGAEQVQRPQQPAGEPPIDEIITATVPTLGRELSRAPSGPASQPFPGQQGFRLLHVANGRALIESTTGMFLVRVGSILPDDSRVATIEQREGKWVIVTSAGAVYENQ